MEVRGVLWRLSASQREPKIKHLGEMLTTHLSGSHLQWFSLVLCETFFFWRLFTFLPYLFSFYVPLLLQQGASNTNLHVHLLLFSDTFCFLWCCSSCLVWALYNQWQKLSHYHQVKHSLSSCSLPNGLFYYDAYKNWQKLSC